MAALVTRINHFRKYIVNFEEKGLKKKIVREP